MTSDALIVRQRMRDRVRADVAILAALLLFTLANSLVSMRWGQPDGATPETTATWAVDTIAPVGPLNEAYHRFTRAGTEDVIYPLFHYVVLAAAYGPYVLYALATGRLTDPSATFPYGARDPAGFFATLTMIAGLVSALMAAGIVLALYGITRELFERRAALIAAGLAALVPPLAYYGMTSNLDVPYLFWMLLATWQLVRAAKHGRPSAFVLSGVFAALAVATKDQAAGFFLAWPVVVLVLVAARHRASGRPIGAAILIDPRIWLTGLAAIAAFALANNLVFGGLEGFLRHLRFADTLYERNVAGAGPGPGLRGLTRAGESARLLYEMMGPAFLLLAAGGLAIAARERNRIALLLPLSALTYFAAILVPTIALSRYLVGVALLAAPFAGLALSRALANARRGWARAALAAGIVSIVWQLALVVHLHATLLRDSRYAMEDWVRANVPAGVTIESYTQARYLPRLADRHRYAIVANTHSAIAYELSDEELTPAALARRSPDYILVLADSWLSGDPGRVQEPAARAYFDELLAGRLGYRVVARHATPTLLPYRQITAGTQPTSILLARMAGT